MLKKFLSALFLTVVIVQMTGIFVVFKIEQYHIRKAIKHQIKAGIPEDELHSFSLSKNEYKNLDWVRTDKEFRINNRMYDVVRFEEFSDSIQIHCVNDHEEATLFVHLDELVNKQLGQESNNPEYPLCQVIKSFKLVYVIEKSWYPIDSLQPFDSSSYYELPITYTSPYIENLTPPPDAV